MEICEIRIPTYRRPAMLRRCLRSLVAQTHADWRAIVLDDSPQQEGRAVVAALGDARIAYRHNHPQLGCCSNIDLAFSGERLAGGTHACVVEDDNWLLADCLAGNLAALRVTGRQVLLRNQRIALELEDGAARLTSRTTSGEVFGGTDRLLGPLQIRASLFFGQGLSNGGIFWDLAAPVSFVVGPSVVFSPLQEYCRSLQAVLPVWYAAEPSAVFSLPEDGSTTREALANRRFNRGRQTILRRLIQLHGGELVDTARELCRGDPDRLARIATGVADCCWLPPAIGASTCRPLLRAWAKGWAKRLTLADPLQQYWQTVGLRPIATTADRTPTPDQAQDTDRNRRRNPPAS